MSGEERFSPGELRRYMSSIDRRLEQLGKDLKERDEKLHVRVNKVEDCINKDVKPSLTQVIADSEWLKKGFWFVAGIGSSALLIVVGALVKGALGG